MSKDDAQAADIVFGYLKSCSRPYSVNDVHNNLQKDFGLGKAAVQRAIDLMVQEGTVREKVYGKQKIYYADQTNTTPVSSQGAAELESRIAELTTERQELAESVRELESQASGLKCGKTLEQLTDELTILLHDCEQMEEKVKKVKAGSGGVDPVVSRKVKQKRIVRVIEWKKRKRIACDSLDAILESCPKPKKAFMEEVGIETDEDYGVVMPKI